MASQDAIQQPVWLRDTLGPNLGAAMVVVTIITAVAALIGAVGALANFWLTLRSHRTAARDERIILGPLDHPYTSVRNLEHARAVVSCAVFNKGRRRALIEEVLAFDEHGKPVDVTWAGTIDDLGNPLEPRSFVGIGDSSRLYVRRSDGTIIHYLRLEISHSFAESPCTAIFDPTADWVSED